MIRQKLIDYYLDYTNNYLTLEKFAEHNEIEVFDASVILALGKTYHERYVEIMKSDPWGGKNPMELFWDGVL